MINPQPLSPAQVADLVARVRAAMERRVRRLMRNGSTREQAEIYVGYPSAGHPRRRPPGAST